MKSEHRHELERNDLAAGVTQALDVAQAGLPRAVWVAGGVIVLGVVAYIGWRYLAEQAAVAQSKVLMRVEALTDPDELKATAGNNANTPAGRLALVKAASILRTQGLQSLGYSPKAARDKLEKANAIYETLLPQTNSDPILAQQCLEGAASIHRTLGNLDKAKEYYDRLASRYSTTLMGQDAAKQAKLIQDRRAELRTFYDELAKRTAPPPPPAMPEPTPVGSVPSAPPQPPAVPAVPGGLTPALPSGKPEAPAPQSTPAAGGVVAPKPTASSPAPVPTTTAPTTTVPTATVPTTTLPTTTAPTAPAPTAPAPKPAADLPKSETPAGASPAAPTTSKTKPGG